MKGDWLLWVHQKNNKLLVIDMKCGYNILSRCFVKTGPNEMNGTNISLRLSSFFQHSLITDITPIWVWWNEEYTAIPSISYESDNLICLSDLCNRFRDTLKPVFKLLFEILMYLNKLPLK